MPSSVPDLDDDRDRRAARARAAARRIGRARERLAQRVHVARAAARQCAMRRCFDAAADGRPTDARAVASRCAGHATSRRSVRATCGGGGGAPGRLRVSTLVAVGASRAPCAPTARTASGPAVTIVQPSASARMPRAAGVDHRLDREDHARLQLEARCRRGRSAAPAARGDCRPMPWPQNSRTTEKRWPSGELLDRAWPMSPRWRAGLHGADAAPHRLVGHLDQRAAPGSRGVPT